MSSPPSSPARLTSLFHHRWAIPLLAALSELGGGAKLITLQNRLSLPRETVKRSLRALDEQRLVRPNPGYGHPMRPEYVATAAGRTVGKLGARLLRELPGDTLRAAALRKWSMPVLLAVHGTDGRFNRLREALPAVTPRALTMALRDLMEAGLVEREVWDTFPPQTAYRATRAGVRPLSTLDQLALLSPE